MKLITQFDKSSQSLPSARAPTIGAAMARPAKRATRKGQGAGRSLVQRVAAAPLLSHPDEARAKVSAWLTAIVPTAAGKTLKRLLADGGPLPSLIEGIADGSPYLWELASTEPARLLVLLQSDPDLHLATLISDTAAAVAGAADQAEAMRTLRRMKVEAALLIA